MNNIIPISEQEKQARISEFIAKFELEYLLFNTIFHINKLTNQLYITDKPKEEASRLLSLIKTGNKDIEELMRMAFETKQSAFIYELGDN